MKNILPNEYIKVGRLKMTIANDIHQKAAYIYITENQVKHIEDRHHVELSKVGFSALDFVKAICSSFNQIRATRNGLLLVKYNSILPYTAVIELQYIDKTNFWEIKTAEPRRVSTVKKKALIWEAAKHTSNGSGNHHN